ncbi:MAG TPA: M57 family metalloprotease [Bacteriovoracaceae bacterium]|nr:M57 family metalloprotease [Bacteriovoracaceae bacterium]
MTKGFLSVIAGMMLVQSSFASVPTIALTFDTNIDLSTISSSSREMKIRTAEEKIKAVIASDAFRTQVLNHTYRGVKKFVDNKGLTNSQIYYKILNAAERLQPTENNTMDMGVKTYYENSSTVGFTSSGSKFINMNTKFLDKYTPTNVTRNMMHEWLHKIGFSHAVSYSTSRDYSVPYGVGKIMETLARNY